MMNEAWACIEAQGDCYIAPDGHVFTSATPPWLKPGESQQRYKTALGHVGSLNFPSHSNE